VGRGRGGGLCLRVARLGPAAAAAAAALGFVLIGVGLYSLPAAAEAVPTNQGAVADGLADVLELHGAPLTLPRADITGATIDYGPTWIQAEVRTFSGLVPQMLLPPPTTVAPQSAPDAGGAPPAAAPDSPARATPGMTRPAATAARPGRRPADSPPPVGVAARAAVRELPRTGPQRLGARPEEPDRARSWLSASEM
jgi:hypothetical protein